MSTPVETTPTKTSPTVWGAIQRRHKQLSSSQLMGSRSEPSSHVASRSDLLSAHPSHLSRGESIVDFIREDDDAHEFTDVPLTRLEQLEARFDLESKINLQSDASGRERYFLRVGYLHKYTRSKFQRFVFILLSNSLIWCSENTRGILSKQGEMLLRNQKCSKVRERDFFIEGAHSFTCTASSKDERDEWVAAINGVLHAKHPLITPRDTIVFQGSVSKIRRSGNNKQSSQYMMLHLDATLAWGTDRPMIAKEATVVDIVPYERFTGDFSMIHEKARNRFLAIYRSKKTNPSLVLFATQQHRDLWLTWWDARRTGRALPSVSVSTSTEVKEQPPQQPIVDDSSAATRLFRILMAGDVNGISTACLQIIKESGAVEISLLLPVLTCMIAGTPFWIRGQCAPIVEAIKERASFDLEVAQATYACYHCGFLEAHPHNSLAYASWCNDIPRRGDICTALKHMYQRPVGFEFFLESTMEAYHPFRGNRIRRVVLEKILDDSPTDVLMNKGLIAIYCYRDESEIKKKERHERKATRIFAQGGRALSPDILLPDSPVQDGFRTVSIILKIGGHMRRDVAYVHMARVINMLWEQDNMVIDEQPIQISTFGAVAFTSHIGVLQMMPEIISMKNVRSVFARPEPSPRRTELELNLMCSAVGAYLAASVLCLSDRNDTNMVLQPDGTVMVGELGPRLLSDSPEQKESLGLTEDFKAVLGELNWDLFVDVLIDCFLALRKHIGTLVQFCTMMLNSVTPANQVVENLQSSFMMDLDVGAACVLLRKRADRLLVSKPVPKREQNAAITVSPLTASPSSDTLLVKGSTPLIIASEQGQFETVEALLGKKADPNQANEDGGTALMLACEFGRQKVAQLLIQRKADVNQLNKDSGNALILASQAGQWDIVRLLLEVKADPKHSDKFDESCMYWANSFGESTIIALLESLGVEPL